MRKVEFFQRLSVKVFVIVALITMVISGFAGYVAYGVSVERQQKNNNQVVFQLARSFESAAATAAYLGDEALAVQITEGLSRNLLVSGAGIYSPGIMNIARGKFDSPSPPISIDLINPFSGTESIGVLKVYPDNQYMLQQASEMAMHSIVVLLLISSMIAVSTSLLIHVVVTRPVSNLAAQLGGVKIDDVKMTKQLDIRYSQHDEIGELIQRINGLMTELNQRCEKAYRLQEKLKLLQGRFRLVFEQASAGIAVINENNQLYAHNRAFEDIMDFSATQNQDVSRLFLNRHDFNQAISEVRRGDCEDQLSKDLPIMRNGELRFIHCLLAKIGDERKSQRTVDSQLTELIVYDVSERRQREQRIRYEADHDPLTQQKNRRAGELALKDLLKVALKNGDQFVLLMIDLDNFKPVNDTFGHDIGDRVLQVVSSHIKYYFNHECDICVRWGGDEFVVGYRIPVFFEDDVLALVNNLLNDLRSPLTVENDITCRISACIGIAVAPNDGEDLSVLVRKADNAMYCAKEGGRDQARFVSE